jgi:hypothetical protein
VTEERSGSEVAQSAEESTAPARPPGHAGELPPALAHGVPAPAAPGKSVPAVEAARAADPGSGRPHDLRATALAVPGHPDGEVDTRPHA